MAQAYPERKIEEQTSLENGVTTLKPGNHIHGSIHTGRSNSLPFKFNAEAPEFVPRSHSTTATAAARAAGVNSNATQMPISGYFYPGFHYLGASGLSDWFFVGDQEPAAYFISSNPNLGLPNCSNKHSSVNHNNVLTGDLCRKIIKQVEYHFSDMSLLANESMSKHISKDPEGYVPISVIASTKKMKSLVSNNNLLTEALWTSSKLILSKDGKKVKRKVPFTEKDREELQSRTVVVENLPEDHSHRNIEKMFGVVGSVKTIRICHPQEPNASRPKSDLFLTNKLHALVEFESSEIAEKAVEKLNDERNWRKGLRVRLLLRCSPKSVFKGRKSDFDGFLDDEDDPDMTEDTSQPNYADSVTVTENNVITENNAEENSNASKKGLAKGSGKGKGRGQSHGGRGLLASPQPVTPVQCEASAKHISKGPKMPNGTRGFTMGRGKPLGTPSMGNSMVA